MNLYKRRILASVIDYTLIFLLWFVFSLIDIPIHYIVFSIQLASDITLDLPSIGFFVLLFPFLFKDCLFRNASLGKKIMKLVILDDEWKKPKLFTMVKRSFFIFTHACLTFPHKEYIKDLLAWEIDHLHTRVIDQQSLRSFHEVCTTKKDYIQNMNRMYSDTFLKSIAPHE